MYTSTTTCTFDASSSLCVTSGLATSTVPALYVTNYFLMMIFLLLLFSFALDRFIGVKIRRNLYNDRGMHDESGRIYFSD